MALFRRGKAQDAPVEEAPATPQAPARTTGPFDRGEVDGIGERLDLGSLWLPGVDGMELRLEIDQTDGSVVGVSAVVGDSALQLQAFAAPRTLGVWDDIRDEIAESIRTAGGQADIVDGEFGSQIDARLPQYDATGQAVLAPVRFIGVDGSRWFLRGFLSGPAVTDEALARPLLDLFAGTVVVRGDQAMAPRELLPLRVPEQQGAPAPAPQDGPGGVQDLSPFERGPEITEVH